MLERPGRHDQDDARRDLDEDETKTCQSVHTPHDGKVLKTFLKTFQGMVGEYVSDS